VTYIRRTYANTVMQTLRRRGEKRESFANNNNNKTPPPHVTDERYPRTRINLVRKLSAEGSIRKKKSHRLDLIR